MKRCHSITPALQALVFTPQGKALMINHTALIANQASRFQQRRPGARSEPIEKSDSRDLQRTIDTLRKLTLSIIPVGIIEKRRYLFSYLLPEALGNHAICSNGTSDSFGSQFQLSNLGFLMNCFILLSVNNIIGEYRIGIVFRWLKANTNSVIPISPSWLALPLLKAFGRKILPSVVESGDILLAGEIIESGVHPDSFGPKSPFVPWRSLLSTAVGNRDLSMAELLCKAGAKPQISDLSESLEGKICLWESENIPFLHTLLRFGADPECFITDRTRGFPLVDAALVGSLEAVSLLLSKGARVNTYVPSHYGTALQAATARGHFELVRFLVRFGADVNAPHGTVYKRDEQEHSWFYSDPSRRALQTPVQIAAENDDTQIIHFLLAENASVITSIISVQRSVPDECYNSPKARPNCEVNGMLSTTIQYAAQNQNYELVALLLSVGVHPDFRVELFYGDTPLQISARLGNQEIASLLLMAGADINAPPATFNGRTAIQGAAESGNIPITRFLLKQGADLNAPAGRIRGMTALQAAALNGDAFMAGFLYAMGADLHADPACEDGLTVIQAAAAGGHTELLGELIDLGGDVNAPGAEERGGTALQAAISHRRLSLIALLVQNGADVNVPASCLYGTPLEDAARFEWLDGAQYLLEHGAKPDNNYVSLDIIKECESPLEWAITNRDNEMAKLLLDSGANVISKRADETWNALECALYRLNEDEVIAWLLEKDGVLGVFYDSSALAKAIRWHAERQTIQLIIDKINTLPKTLRDEHIRLAWDDFPPECWEGNWASEALEILLKAGSDINSRHHRTQTTALQRMISVGRGDSISLLLDRGAEINVPATPHMGTPLQIAIGWCNTKAISLLLENGADVNAPPATDSGRTALQKAAMNGLIQVAITLLQRGADVAAPAAPIDGRAAIDSAAEHGRWDMLQLLLNAYEGSEDIRVVCMRAASYAREQDHIEIAEWLEKYPSA